MLGTLFHRDSIFFDLFDELSTHVVASAEHLRRLATGFPESEPEIGRIHEVEHAADDVSHRVLDRLNHSFMPPIDATDVHVLAGNLDDIVDAADAAAQRVSLYHLDAVEPLFVRQTEVLLRATAKVSEAVHQLRRTRALADLRSTLIEIHRLESEGDDNHHAALAKLFDGTFAPLFVLKWKELHTLVEQAIDYCEDVGNTLERVTLKK